ncbi:hypothetical protein CVT26_001717 [Gymnopilus dilepis]|uniref:BZIP domain-containing protein n=1 Tax=Gymnopilus dilepis TaxID=231916 RepID=A0A409VRA4_9AGAR|nr:hypothetical protein CVT26_001717 [Gymnopilus dilepis]
MSSGSSHAALPERPERSRNAKAQARHRAKRKAYIEQLEQTVTKLQVAVGFTGEQIAALPPPLLKIRELEQDNARLQKENDELRRLLTDPNSRSIPSDSIRRSGSIGTYPDARACDREYSLKRRKSDGVYISPSDTPPHVHDSSRPPPPLTIPQPLSHYGSLHTSSNGHDHHGISSYSQPTPHYSSVKVEDDHYSTASHHTHQTMHYSYSPTNHNHGNGGMDWHNAYSSERGHIHR